MQAKSPKTIERARLWYAALEGEYEKLSRAMDNARDYPRDAVYEIRRFCEVCDNMAKLARIIDSAG